MTLGALGSTPSPLPPNTDGLSLVGDSWLSEQLHRPVFRVRSDQRASDIAAPATGSFVYARIPLANLSEATDLVRRGFSVVEVSVSLDLDPLIASAIEVPAGIRVRPASDSDVAAIEDIARRSLIHSRFHQDPALDNADAAEIKAAWAGNLGRGERGIACWVAERRGGVIGFLGATAVSQEDSCVAIDLIATDPAQQGSGAGSALVEQLRLWASRRGALVRTGTQLSNSTAIRFYESRGFRFSGSDIILHGHF